jgi:hypothetical protein
MEASQRIRRQVATRSEILLLQAALLEGPAAAEAAQKWLADVSNREFRHGFQELDKASRRLLPLVYRNTRACFPPELQNQLRLVHHQAWVDNQKRFRHLEKLLAWFNAHQYPTLLLKGAALTLLHYRDMALRPMSDFDILVREEHLPEIAELLQRDGWTIIYYLPTSPSNDYFCRFTHALPFTRPDFGVLDLHCHVLADATFRGADEEFWSGSVPLTVNGIETRGLNPTDQLIHTCVHGFPANELAPIRWIADAMAIFRTSEIDWGRLVKLARDLHVTIPLAYSLSLLRDTFPAPIPAEVIGELDQTPVDKKESRYFGMLVQSNLDFQEVLAYNLERHRRATRDRTPLSRIPSLIRQFQLHYNLPHLTDLGALAFLILGKRLRKGIALP